MKLKNKEKQSSAALYKKYNNRRNVYLCLLLPHYRIARLGAAIPVSLHKAVTAKPIVR